MIVLDSSALFAIVAAEPEAEVFARLISENDCLIGAPTRLESYLVVRSKTSDAHVANLLRVLGWRNVTAVDFTAAHADVAAVAFDRFGKGRKHPAQLNFGDCMTYAVAKVSDLPLLYKGEDFVHTDIRPAMPASGPK